jgi:hypothetical protein
MSGLVVIRQPFSRYWPAQLGQSRGGEPSLIRVIYACERLSQAQPTGSPTTEPLLLMPHARPNVPRACRGRLRYSEFVSARPVEPGPPAQRITSSL